MSSSVSIRTYRLVRNYVSDPVLHMIHGSRHTHTTSEVSFHRHGYQI
jgi:hypothetical protein